jgi:hypothetical protein
MQLLHISHAAGSAHSDTHDQGNSLTLRLAAIGLIFAAGLLAVVPPILSHWLPLFSISSQSSTLARVMRAFSGGTILALALVRAGDEGCTSDRQACLHVLTPMACQHNTNTKHTGPHHS